MTGRGKLHLIMSKYCLLLIFSHPVKFVGLGSRKLDEVHAHDIITTPIDTIFIVHFFAYMGLSDGVEAHRLASKPLRLELVHTK